MSAASEFLVGKRRIRFEGLTRCLVPRSRQFTEVQWTESRRLVNEILADKPPAVHRKIGMFLWLMDFASILLTGRTVRNANPSDQKRVMDTFFDSPIAIFRKGFWGVNTLAKLAVYGQSEINAEIGYVQKTLQQEEAARFHIRTQILIFSSLATVQVVVQLQKNWLHFAQRAHALVCWNGAGILKKNTTHAGKFPWRRNTFLIREDFTQHRRT